jgi:predicted esterase
VIESMTPRLIIAIVVTLASGVGAADESVPAKGDPNFDHPNEVVTVAREGYSIAGLVTHKQGGSAFKYGVALFPGHPGIMKLRLEAGRPVYGLGGNFLVRSRRHWLDGETLVLVMDAPSDQWAAFEHWFRERPRYGADVAALVQEVARRYGVADWTFVGTSEGSLSAFHAARMNPALARRVILTSSLLLPSRHGAGLSGTKWETLSVPLLWVHHKYDPCAYTPYREAQKAAVASRSPLVTVAGGGPGQGNPCEARTAHGFVGIEVETIKAMRQWIKSGAVPADVNK